MPWIEFLAEHPAAPFGDVLRDHISVGRITRLRACGCGSFDPVIPQGVALKELSKPKWPWKILRGFFDSDTQDPVAFLFFSDDRGYLAGIDITLGSGNHGPVPKKVELGKVLYVV